jgi:hypothetical protein
MNSLLSVEWQNVVKVDPKKKPTRKEDFRSMSTEMAPVRNYGHWQCLLWVVKHFYIVR